MATSAPQKSILIIRFTAIGDIVMANPVATAIKKNHPDTLIAWVVHPKYRALLADHPDIDEVITFDLDKWQSLWRQKRLPSLLKQVQALRKQLTPFAFEKVIDLQGNGTSGFIAWLSKALHRIALGSEGANSWFMTKTISKNLGEQIQIGSEYRYLVNQLGCSDNRWEMHLPHSDTAQTKATALLSDAFETAQFAVICPFSKLPQKKWVDDYWVQIILRIRGRYQLRTVILGDGSDREQGEQIAQKSGALNLCSNMPLEESAAIIQNASLVIGIDTGLTHMGHAIPTPTWKMKQARSSTSTATAHPAEKTPPAVKNISA